MRSIDLPLTCSMLVLAALAPGAAHAQTAPAPAQDKPAEVTVKGTRGDVIALPDRTSFNVANDLQAQNGTIADALRNVPGVEVDLEGKVSLRGDPGVTILIDGRPSAMMKGEGRGDVLLSMPAGRIERVEVITNPSAAMSPEGSAGVLNLVTKQARPGDGGASGTVRANLGGQGRGTLNLSGNVSRPGMTMTGDLAYRRFTSDTGITQDRARIDPLTGSFAGSRQESTQDNTMSARMARFAIDYDPDKANRLSGEISYRKAGIEGRRIDRFTGATPAASYDRVSDIEQRQRNAGVRASWRHSIAKDHELFADIQIDQGGQSRTLEGATTPAAGAPGFERIGNAADRAEYNIKLDYKRPMGAGEALNLGYEVNVGTGRFDFTGARGLAADALFPVASLTNRFDFDQTVHALYGTAQFALGAVELQPGLRLEQAEIDLDQITDNVRVAQDYLRAYPTLHAGLEIARNQRLRGSYSRRIQRPSPLDLNPYTFYIDPLNVRRGNPALLPEVTDSFELGWQLRDGGTFYSLTGFYRVSRDGVTEVFQDLGGGVLLSTRANLATGKRAGAELIANGKLSKTLGYNASATVFWNEIDPRTAGIAAPRSGTTASARASLTWQPSANDFFQLNGNYAGRQLVAQGYRESGGVLNLGYRRKVNERLSLVLTGQNMLDSARQTIVIDTLSIRDRVTQRGVGRAFLIGITYNLGNQGGRRRGEPGFDFDQGGGVPQ